MEKGFTIIELVISILIVSLSIVGVFSAFNIMSIFSADAADRLTATYLAQEGMEIVRNVRDSNWIDIDVCTENGTPLDNQCPGNWLDGFGGIGVSDNLCANGCEADYKSTGNGTSIPLFAASSRLYLDQNGFFTTNTGTRTKFQRKIIVQKINNFTGSNDVVKVTSQVSWDAKRNVLSRDYSQADASDCNSKNCVKIIETLYDWYNPMTLEEIYDDRLAQDFQRIYDAAWADYRGSNDWAPDVTTGEKPDFFGENDGFDASYYCSTCYFDYQNWSSDYDGNDCVMIDLYKDNEPYRRRTISCAGCPQHCNNIPAEQ